MSIPVDVQFLNWATPRVGPTNAINLAKGAQANALVELLIEKGIFTKAEIDAKNTKFFDQVKAQMSNIPPVSPIQNRS